MQSSKEQQGEDKKAFLSDQCREIGENNRTGKARDLFKKIRDTKEIFHIKIDMIKDRNGLVFPSLKELSIVCCDPPTVKGFYIVNKTEVDIFSGTLLLFQ